jgi:hypothetical protein
MWSRGNPFAWHLWLEARLLYASDGLDYLAELSAPSPYVQCGPDCRKFLALFREARASLLAPDCTTHVFELSTIFLSIRNAATCFSLGTMPRPVFSRKSARCLGPNSLSIDENAYAILERARILSSRGGGACLDLWEIEPIMILLHRIDQWLVSLAEVAEQHG